MQLRRVYHHDLSLNEELRLAVDIAWSLEDFPSWDRVQDVLGQIPDSSNYFTYPINSEYGGYEIHILVPLILLGRDVNKRTLKAP